jgi:hypothetical protein
MPIASDRWMCEFAMAEYVQDFEALDRVFWIGVKKGELPFPGEDGVKTGYL